MTNRSFHMILREVWRRYIGRFMKNGANDFNDFMYIYIYMHTFYRYVSCMSIDLFGVCQLVFWVYFCGLVWCISIGLFGVFQMACFVFVNRLVWCS